MEKYVCSGCQELFEVARPPQVVKCPRCSSREIQESDICMREIGPPAWEYLCQKCDTRFRVKSPSGPDEAKQIRCPVCENKKVQWLALVSETCPTGG